MRIDARVLYRNTSRTLLLVALALAPWIAGSIGESTNRIWFLAGLLGVSGAFALPGFLRDLRRGSIPKWIVGGIGMLLVCIAFWAWRGPPAWESAFTQRQFEILGERSPTQFLPMSQQLRLAFWGAVVAGFIAATQLGKSRRWRIAMVSTLGISGMLLLGYAAGITFLQWPVPVDSLNHPHHPAVNVTFYAYFGTALTVLIATLATGSWLAFNHGTGSLAAIVAVAGMASLRLWPAESIQLLGFGALIAAVSLHNLARVVPVERLRKLTLVAAVSAAPAVMAIQFVACANHLRSFPAIATSPAASRPAMPTRDEIYEQAASQRGDRLVEDPAPGRLSAWAAAAYMALDAGPIGPGPGSWSRRAAAFSNSGAVNSIPYYLGAAHHDPLQFTAEWGWLPAAFATATLILALKRQSGRTGQDLVENAVLIALLACLITSLGHWPLHIPATATWFIALLGIAASPPGPSRSSPNEASIIQS